MELQVVGGTFGKWMVASLFCRIFMTFGARVGLLLGGVSHGEAHVPRVERIPTSGLSLTKFAHDNVSTQVNVNDDVRDFRLP